VTNQLGSISTFQIFEFNILIGRLPTCKQPVFSFNNYNIIGTCDLHMLGMIASLGLCKVKLGRCRQAGVFFGPDVAEAAHIPLFVVEDCLLESFIVML
jgi:hypothetical protein